MRGLGAMVAMELVREGATRIAPDADLTRALVQAAAKRGLILLSCGVYSNVIRFLAPLTIRDALSPRGSEMPRGGARGSRGREASAARGQALPAFESVGVWKYSLSPASSSISRLSSAMRAFGGADRHAVLAARIAAGLARVQPVLDRAGEQAVGDVPQVGILVLVGELVAEVDGAREGGIEGVWWILACGVPSNRRPSF